MTNSNDKPFTVRYGAKNDGPKEVAFATQAEADAYNEGVGGKVTERKAAPVPTPPKTTQS